MTASDIDQKAYLTALRLLAGRDYTVSAITKKLMLRGYEQQVVETAVSRLKQDGFLNDLRYAERFVESARNSGRYVGYRLRQELRRRGIETDLIDTFLAGEQDPDEEVASARNLMERRYSGFDQVDASDQTRKRIAGFLQRRGFSSATIWKLLSRRTCVE